MRVGGLAIDRGRVGTVSEWPGSPSGNQAVTPCVACSSHITPCHLRSYSYYLSFILTSHHTRQHVRTPNFSHQLYARQTANSERAVPIASIKLLDSPATTYLGTTKDTGTDKCLNNRLIKSNKVVGGVHPNNNVYVSSG